MKTKFTIILACLFYSSIISSQTFTFQGINYIVTSPTTVGVSTNPTNFNGVANIPSNVSYNSSFYSVTSIGNNAFNNCSALTAINIPNSVTSIGNSAFYYCASLTSVNIPNSVTSIGTYSFGYCSGLTSVNIPNSVTNIGDGAFYYCSGLTSLNIPNSLTSINTGVFYYCSGLTSVNIPNSVTSIGYNAFSYCLGLTSVNIPNSVTSIGGNAFSYCTSLTSVNIPNSVTSIGNLAFRYCSGLTSVTVNWMTPLPTSSSNAIFSGLNLATIILYVPFGTTALYEAAPVWTDFAPITVLGMNDFTFNNENVYIYPNPSSNYFIIQSKDYSIENFEYKLIDLTGKVVKNGNSKFNEQINIENLENGNYILQLENDRGEKLTKKLIKN